jgi:hypothetical protein
MNKWNEMKIVKEVTITTTFKFIFSAKLAQIYRLQYNILTF